MRAHALLLTTALAAGLAAAGCQKADTSAANPNAPADTAAAPPAKTADASAAGANAGMTGAATPAPAATAADFVQAAGNSDMYEINAAKIAQQKTKNPKIKAFAAKMIHDHGASTAKLKAAIASGKVNATPPTALDDRHKGMIDQLNQADAGAFDKTYMDQQVAAHTEATSLFQSYSGGGDNPALKAFAGQILPIIQQHLQMAKDLDANMK